MGIFFKINLPDKKFPFQRKGGWDFPKPQMSGGFSSGSLRKKIFFIKFFLTNVFIEYEK